MTSVEFFRRFFIDFMSNVESVTKQRIDIGNLFLEMPIQKLEDFLSKDLYVEFTDFTNSNMDKTNAVSNGFIEYEMILNARRFGRAYNAVHFKKISKDITEYITRHFTVKRKMDDVKMDIVGFAASAPVSARGLRFNIYKGYLSKISLTYIEEYLGQMVKEGLLKKKGIYYALP